MPNFKSNPEALNVENNPPFASVFASVGPDPLSLIQTDWYINPTTGKDTKDGLTPQTAIKTFAELSRRWGKGNLLSPPGANYESTPLYITVHICGSLPPSDPLNFDVILDGNVHLQFVGFGVESSTPLTVTPSSIITKNRDAGIPWQFKTSDALEVGERIHVINKGGYLWPFYKEGNAFRLSEPLTKYVNPISDLLAAESRVNELSATDTFEIHTLRNIKTGSMRIGSVRTGSTIQTRNKLVFKDLKITGDISPEMDMGTRLFCHGCRIEGSIQLASGFERNFINCCQVPGQRPMIRIISGLTRFHGGAYISYEGNAPNYSQGFLPTNCTTQLDFDVIFQTHSISIVAGNTLIIGTAGIFDSVSGGNGRSNMPGNGIMVSAGSVTCRTLSDNTHQLWGSVQTSHSVQTGHGVGVSSGGRFYYVSNPPTITGRKGHFTLGEATNTNSWSNLDAKGNAKNLDFDAWILKTQ